MRRNIVRLFQIGVLVLGFFVLVLPDHQVIVRADCGDRCVETDDGDPGCQIGTGGYSSDCDLWEDWSWFGEVLLVAGCDEVFCEGGIAE